MLTYVIIARPDVWQSLRALLRNPWFVYTRSLTAVRKVRRLIDRLCVEAAVPAPSVAEVGCGDRLSKTSGDVTTVDGGNIAGGIALGVAQRPDFSLCTLVRDM